MTDNQFGLADLPQNRTRASRSQGLNPVELLDLPAAHRQLITWMMRQTVVSVDQIVQHFEQSPGDVQAMLDSLLAQGLVQLDDSEESTAYYRVKMGRRRGRSPAKSSSAAMWDKLG